MNVLTVTIAVLCLLAADAATCKDICSEGALSCQTNEEASTCKNGYGLTSDNKCVKCGVSPIARGTGTGADGSNAGGGKWWEPWNSGSCVECKANCEVCGTKTTCTTCKTGYTLVEAACKACTVSQAATCTGDVTTATTCNAGFAKQTDGKKCYTRCNAGQFEDKAAGTCVTCDANALSCTDATTPDQCKSGYSKIGTKCEKCTVSQAATCTTEAATATSCKAEYTKQTDGKKCYASCKAGQFEDAAAGTCVMCDANALTCTSATVALKCNPGYRKEGDKCEACDTGNCKTCDTKKENCEICKDGYAKDCPKCNTFPWTDATCDVCDNSDASEQVSCVPCDANAAVCTNQYTAASCKAGYEVAENGKCVSCDRRKDGQSKKSTEADPKGVAPTTNWWMKQGATRTCLSILTGCVSGSMKLKDDGTGWCEKCDQAAYWPHNKAGAALAKDAVPGEGGVAGTCKLIDINCAALASATVCTTCKEGYKSTAALCVKCTVSQAATCNTEAVTATTCKTDYTMKADGKACFANCKAGQFADATAGKCVTCDANAATCTDATTVDACNPGYLKIGTKCEKCTVSQAATCTGDVTTATACNPLYTMKADGKACFLKCKAGQHTDAAAGKCVTCDVNAFSCTDATTANVCNSGYRKEGTKCEACTVTNCHVCDTVKTTCTACQGKYALNKAETSCALVCDAHATSCTDANTAASCDTAKNYHLSVGRCIYCDVPLNAETGAIDHTKAGNKIFFDSTTGRCGTCDLYASGCATALTASACIATHALTTGTDMAGHCKEKCPAWNKDLGGAGKCYSCGANVVGGYCASPAEGLQCNSGYHIMGAGQGYCCKDKAAAPGPQQKVSMTVPSTQVEVEEINNNPVKKAAAVQAATNALKQEYKDAGAKCDDATGNTTARRKLSSRRLATYTVTYVFSGSADAMGALAKNPSAFFANFPGCDDNCLKTQVTIKVHDTTNGANSAFRGLLAFAGAAIAASLIVVW